MDLESEYYMQDLDQRRTMNMSQTVDLRWCWDTTSRYLSDDQISVLQKIA